MRMKVVGRRRWTADPWAEVDALVRFVGEMRRGAPLCRRGVFRFRTHQEADAWMRAELIAERHGLRRAPI